MRTFHAAIVALGLALCLALAIREGLDVRGAVTLVFIVTFGVLAFGVIRKSATGRVQPARCPACSGLNSPNAPYCKHCGAHFEG